MPFIRPSLKKKITSEGVEDIYKLARRSTKNLVVKVITVLAAINIR